MRYTISSRDTGSSQRYLGKSPSDRPRPVGTQPLLSPAKSQANLAVIEIGRDRDVNFRGQKSGTQSTIREYKKSITFVQHLDFH
jgi:hypothetical protein